MEPNLQELLAQAKGMISERRYNDAVRLCRRILLSSPNETSVRILLGMAMLGLRRYDQVRMEMLALLRVVPNDASVYRTLGEAYLRSSHPDQALVALRKALRIEPNDRATLDLLAEAEEETVPYSATVDRWFDPQGMETDRIEAQEALDDDDTAEGHDVGEDPLEVEPTAIGKSADIWELAQTARRWSSTDDAMENVPTAAREAADDDPLESVPTTIAATNFKLPKKKSVPPRASQPPQEPSPDFFAAAPDLGINERPRISSSPFAKHRPAPTSPVPRKADSPWVPLPRAVVPSVEALPKTPTPQHKKSAAQTREMRNRRMMFAGIGSVFVILVGVGAYQLRPWSQGPHRNAKLQAAIVAATSDGLSQTLFKAIQIVRASRGDLSPIKARLEAMAFFEQNAPDAKKRADVELKKIAHPESYADANLANALIELERGELSRANEWSLRVRGNADQTAEASRIRSLIAAAMGFYARAVIEASAAMEGRSTAPRHVALYSLMTAADGDASAGIAALDGLPRGDAYPCVRIARARILSNSASTEPQAKAEATYVLKHMTNVASSCELAWAHFIVARSLVNAGDSIGAVEEGEKAIEFCPKSEVTFHQGLANLFLQLHSPENARAVLRRVPEVAAHSEQHAKLQAELALDTGHLDIAEAALRKAGKDAHAQYLRGLWNDRSGKLKEARELYQLASVDEKELVRSRVRIAKLEEKTDNIAGAIAQLEELSKLTGVHREVLPALARLYINTHRLADAERLIGETAQSNAPEYVLARAWLDLTKGNQNANWSPLKKLETRVPGNVEILLTVGEVSRALRDFQKAEEAYRKVLGIYPRNVDALAGMIHTALDQGDRYAAHVIVEGTRGALENEDPLRTARARAMVAEGEGAHAVSILRSLAESKPSVALWTLLGRAHFQAEQDPSATISFERALRFDPKDPEAHLGLAFIALRGGKLQTGQRHMEAAQQELAQRFPRPDLEAQAFVIQGALEFERGNLSDATQWIQRALERDRLCGEAHLIAANIEVEKRGDAISHLRAAMNARVLIPEAIGRLAIALRSGEEACALAKRYNASAPDGYDSPQVSKVLAHCTN